MEFYSGFVKEYHIWGCQIVSSVYCGYPYFTVFRSRTRKLFHFGSMRGS